MGGEVCEDGGTGRARHPGPLLNALRKIERKEGTFRTVERGNSLPQITTLDPLDPKKQLVAESTQQRKGSTRTGEEYKGVIGWWTRRMPPRGKGPDGYEREPVRVLEKIQAWQPTPEQQQDIALGAVTSMALLVIGKMFTSPFGLG